VTDDRKRLFEDLRAKYAGRDKRALLRAVLYAGMFRHPLPDWATDAFNAALEYVEHGGEWDDVFGRPLLKGRHRDSVKLDAQKYDVWQLVRSLAVGKNMAISNGG